MEMSEKWTVTIGSALEKQAFHFSSDKKGSIKERMIWAAPVGGFAFGNVIVQLRRMNS